MFNTIIYGFSLEIRIFLWGFLYGLGQFLLILDDVPYFYVYPLFYQ